MSLRPAWAIKILSKKKKKSPYYQNSVKLNETCAIIIKLYIPVKHRNPSLFCKDLTIVPDSETVILLLVYLKY